MLQNAAVKEESNSKSTLSKQLTNLVLTNACIMHVKKSLMKLVTFGYLNEGTANILDFKGETMNYIIYTTSNIE